MRIAISAVNLNHSVISGLLVYVENLLHELAQIDLQNEYFLIFTSLRKKPFQMPGPTAKNFVKKILPVPDRNLPFRQMLIDNIYLPYLFKKYRCNVYHAPAGYNLPSSNGVKKILTIHDLRSSKITDRSFPQSISSLRKAAKNSDVCITVSECTKKDIIEHLDINPDKIKIIYNGVNEEFKPLDIKVSEEIRNRYNIHEKFIFSLGEVPRKNVERLIKAFCKFKYKNDFLLVIGGAREYGPWISKYRELINKLKMGDRIRLIGYLPYEDLPLFYNASEFFVFPSLYEGFGIPILEAMKCGVAVITSNVSALPEIGRDAVLYVDPYSEEDIARQMERLIEDKELKDTLVKKGIDRAKEFSWKKMAIETLKIYEEV